MSVTQRTIQSFINQHFEKKNAKKTFKNLVERNQCTKFANDNTIYTKYCKVSVTLPTVSGKTNLL